MLNNLADPPCDNRGDHAEALMSQSGQLQPEAITLEALARSLTNKFHSFTGCRFNFQLSHLSIFRCRASCASHYSKSTQASPDLVASYGGFDDTIIDPFGFPLRLDSDTTKQRFKERWVQSVRPLPRNDKELSTSASGKVAALSGLQSKAKQSKSLLTSCVRH